MDDFWSKLEKTIFDIEVPNYLGNQVKLSEYKGRNAYLVVNVACECGLTSSNYKELQILYEVRNYFIYKYFYRSPSST